MAAKCIVIECDNIGTIDQDGYCDQCFSGMRMQKAADEYYKPTHTVVMVPVKVAYHDASDTIYSFIPPTEDDIREALKNKPQTFISPDRVE